MGEKVFTRAIVVYQVLEIMLICSRKLTWLNSSCSWSYHLIKVKIIRCSAPRWLFLMLRPDDLNNNRKGFTYFRHLMVPSVTFIPLLYCFFVYFLNFGTFDESRSSPMTHLPMSQADSVSILLTGCSEYLSVTGIVTARQFGDLLSSKTPSISWTYKSLFGQRTIVMYWDINFILGLVFTNGEGNGTPLQYSCLENPMGGRAW